MIKAMIICPTTGRPVFTGLAFGSLAAFDATTLVNNYVQCNLCGERHLVDNSTVKVFPSEPSERR
ncbi:MAG: hypothetical protein JO175_00045 [Candidatus Eremiobacteraeota bacterium]|nr:hypothetical protein [Candidatus Eremiobacteraeota bacterium]